MARDKIVVDLSNGGNIQTNVPLSVEEEAEADAAYAADLARPPSYHLNGGALIRFTATNPVTVLENIGMAGVSRIAKGRYRASHLAPMPSDQYSVFPDLLDLADKRIRVTARTIDYVEVRIVDSAGVAADATEASIKIERVLTT